MKKLFYIVFIGLACTCCMHEENITWDDSPEGNLRALWTIIDEKYCFVEEKGLDWNGVLADYLPKTDTLKSKNYRELFDIMAQMLDTLQDGHVNLYSSFDVSSCKKWYEGYPNNYNAGLISRYLGDYKTAGGLVYNIIPESPQIGYIRYSSFSSGFSSANMYYVLSYFKDCKGLIIDVRNNGGGSLENAWKLASSFMKETTHIGYWQHKIGPGHNDMSTPEKMYVDSSDMTVKWLRPVVVLCNRHSYSATNSFVSAMRYAPYSTIIGGKTGGGGGMPMSYELPNGWMVRFSSIKMMDREMKSIEEGIDPDEEITLTSNDKDDLIERGIEVIKEKYIASKLQ